MDPSVRTVIEAVGPKDAFEGLGHEGLEIISHSLEPSTGGQGWFAGVVQFATSPPGAGTSKPYYYMVKIREEPIEATRPPEFPPVPEGRACPATGGRYPCGHASCIEGGCLIEGSVPQDSTVRTFDSGATRDLADDKLDFEGFLSPAVIQRFAEYMHQHRFLKDGSVRSSDNWQKGIPVDVYVKSLFRHFVEVWAMHRGVPVVRPEDPDYVEDIEETLCAILFNVQGMLYEVLQNQRLGYIEDVEEMEAAS